MQFDKIKEELVVEKIVNILRKRLEELGKGQVISNPSYNVVGFLYQSAKDIIRLKEIVGKFKVKSL